MYMISSVICALFLMARAAEGRDGVGVSTFLLLVHESVKKKVINLCMNLLTNLSVEKEP